MPIQDCSVENTLDLISSTNYLSQNSNYKVKRSKVLFYLVLLNSYQPTSATAVVILLPPAAPMTKTTSPFASVITDGHIEDKGLLPGAIKLAGEGGRPKAFVILGEEKSSISSFKIMPVLSDAKPAPNLQ